jgi:twinkle protein
VLPDTKLSPPTEKIYEYFEKRKISRATVDAFKIKSDENGMIVFPFYENGINVFEKFRRPWKPNENEKKMKEWRFPGAKPVLFGMDMCVFSQPLTITEGEIDCMSLYEAGIQNVVSVPSGCDDMSWVEHCWDWLEKFKTIILFGDNDEPGRKMVQTLAKRLDESRCRIVEDYPDSPRGGQCKDANEILLLLGPFELLDMIENAKEIPVKGLIDLSTVVPIDPTTVPRIKTNIPKLDSLTGGLLEGGVSVIVGKAGSGKSCLANGIILNAVEQGFTVCLYTGEFTVARAQYWLNLQAAGSDYLTLKYDPVKDKKIPVVPYAVEQRILDWYKGKLFIYNNDEIFESDQADAVLGVFTSAVRRYGAKLLVIDNLMCVTSDKEDETAAQRIFANKLKNFARKYEVAVLLVAHARKTKAGEKLNADDLSGSSATNNLADMTLSVEPGTITILKNREEGTRQTIEFCYCPDSKRVYQADRGDTMKLGWDKTGLRSPDIRADSMEEYKVVPPPTGQPF